MRSKRWLKSQGILNLLISTPDVGQWKSLSDEQMLEAMGGGDYKGRRELIQELRKVMGSFQPASDSMALLLSSSAHAHPAAQGGAAGHRADAGEADRGERGGAGVAADEGNRDEYRGQDDRRNHRHQAFCP